MFLSWATGINASGLFREALSEQMSYRNIDRHQLVDLVERTLRDENRDLEELCERTTGLDDLEALIEDRGNQSKSTSNE
ncbi:hypothetical protein [Halovivax limisalsi]|uniref:hypothetical protein n=1 Tax=Halovivax limisalsi TaxID=1453760 RepID=UPI001FFD1C3C|nr:hypothetical protein [Halovivax limisalsi]